MIDTNGGNTRQLAGAQCFRRDSVLGSAWSGTTVPLGAPGTSTVPSFGNVVASDHSAAQLTRW